MESPINSKFDSFIAENLVIYTQIFVHILPRFERLDFTSFPNVIMLHRLVKVSFFYFFFMVPYSKQVLFNALKQLIGLQSIYFTQQIISC